jgi:hypothetical protein
MKPNIIALVLLLITALPSLTAAEEPKAPDPEKPPIFAGLRRSSLGFKEKNADDAWWVDRTKEFAASLRGPRQEDPPVVPLIIQIVSIYLDEGNTRFEFEKPEEYKGATEGMTFGAGEVDHERALAAYDKAGVKAILQVEPGRADVASCLEIMNLRFGRHRCVAGYGVDAEWYRTAESEDKTGLPVKDADAEAWVKKVLAFDPKATLFLKHWDPSHMPAKFRHPNLWFLSDSQKFKDLREMLDDFTSWGAAFKDQAVGYQFGYPADRKWWEKMAQPPEEIGRAVLKEIPRTRFLFWVDFTAGKVEFRRG